MHQTGTFKNEIHVLSESYAFSSWQSQQSVANSVSKANEIAPIVIQDTVQGFYPFWIDISVTDDPTRRVSNGRKVS